jgi:ElaB/YqjD/DUF883 family membrane-anchored ribosome-binding protein
MAVKAAQIVKAVRQSTDETIKTTKAALNSAKTQAKDAIRTGKEAIDDKTKTKIAAAAGIPIAAGVGIGVGSYVGLKGVSSGVKEVASGGSKGVTSLAIGLAFIGILAVIIVYTFRQIKRA